MDKAKLAIHNTLKNANITFSSRVTECYECPVSLQGIISPDSVVHFKVDTRWETEYVIERDGRTDSDIMSQITCCHRYYNFREGGNYTLYTSANSSSEQCICLFSFDTPEIDSNIPIYVALAILILLILAGIGYSALKQTTVYKKVFADDTAFNEDLGGTSDCHTSESGRETSISSNQLFRTPIPPRPQKQRLKSLDAFRGLSLLIMIFVNYGGGGYWFFKHSPWNGLTVADLVFPWFIFIMGTAIALVFKNVHNRPVSKGFFIVRIWKRAIILFALGIFLNSGKIDGDLTKLRIPGVLQRIAISYGMTATIDVLFSRPVRNVRLTIFHDQLYLIPYWIINLAFVTAWCAVTFAMYVPGCGRGYIGPGGIQWNGSMVNCSGGAAGAIDKWLFGDDHRYCTPTFRHVYNTTACYDPEGILGSFNSIFLCFLGLMAGKILVMMPNWKSVTRRFAFWSVVCGAVALILSKASANTGFIPINKNLWSLSFVLATGGMAYFLFGIFYLMIDVIKVWSGEPLIYPGMNSVIIYVGHEVLEDYFPISWDVPKTHASQLAMDIWGTTFWLFVSYFLYRKKMFFSV